MKPDRFSGSQRQELQRLYYPIDPAVLLASAQAAGFSFEAYRAGNADLVAAQHDDAQLACHYFKHGVFEDRHFNSCVEAFELAPLIELCSGTVSAAQRRLVANLLYNQCRSARDLESGTVLERLVRTTQRMPIQPFLVIGDSHSDAYALPRDDGERFYVPFHVACTGGSAIGLGNPASKSGYAQKIARFLERHADLIRTHCIPCFMKFGQVDVEFVWTFRRARERVAEWSFDDFERFAEESAAAYARFAGEMAERFGLHDFLRMCSVFPPCLSDEAWLSGYIDAHVGFLETESALDELVAQVKTLRIPNLFERTRQHALWNALLMRHCARLGLLYVDDFTRMVGTSGVVDAALVAGHSGRDHHLPHPRIGPIVQDVIVRHAAVSRLGTSPFRRP